MISVIGNLKGGTGKSTVAFNLAVWLAVNKKKVKAFDLDPQETLSDVFAIRKEDEYQPEVNIANSFDSLVKSKEDNSTEYLVDVGTSGLNAMKGAIAIADRIIVPVAPSQADIWATQRFIKLVKEVCSNNKKKPTLLGFINRADTHIAVRETKEAEEALQHLTGIKLIDVRLYQRTLYRRSFSEGLAVFEQEPRGKASAELNKLATILYSSLFIL